MEQAACRGMDTSLFFPELGDSPSKMNEAKLVCFSCTVRPDCSDYRERTGSSGLWGGKLTKPGDE